MLVELTRAAEADVGDAAVAYELERPGLGFRFEEEVDRVLAAIAENPRQYQVVAPDVRRGLVRVFPYSVYFTIFVDRARVFAVLHQHRDPDTWKARDR